MGNPATPDEVLDDLFSIGNLTDEQYRAVKRLRAENESLKRALDFAEGEIAGLADERLQRENRELKAENERLQSEVEGLIGGQIEVARVRTAYVNELLAENQRLREKWHQSEQARIDGVDQNERLRAELETLKRQLTDAVLSLPPADDLDV